jgi:flagella basal body P-ring formation protein FlgA
MRNSTRLAALLVLTTAAATLCMGAAPETWTIGLREAVTVSGQALRLGQVAELSESAPERAADVPLGNAPWPGRIRRVTHHLVMSRLIAAGFDRGEFSLFGPEVCTVELSTLQVEGERMAEAARQHVLSFFPDGGPEIQVEMLDEPAPVLVPAAGGEPQLRPVLSGSGAPTGLVRVDVELVRDGARLKRVPVSLMVRLYAPVAVARRRIAAGQQAVAGDVILLRREITNVHGRCLRDLAELKGMAAAHTIQPGEIITTRDLRPAERPVAIERNQRVFLIVRTATLRVQAIGVALDTARLGEVARAKNMATGREVVGLAAEQGVIRVPLGETDYE